MSYLKVNRLFKKYSPNSKCILDNILFDVNEGEIISLLGRSGCGKTTLLKSIAGLEVPSSGDIILDNNILSDGYTFIQPENRDIIIVFQDYALFPHLNTYYNIAYGLTTFSKKIRHEKIIEMIKLFELDSVQSKYPHQISGGQQQRLALARALVLNPKVLLIDEPFTNLDWNLRSNISRKIIRIIKNKSTTVIMATHDKEIALTLSDRVLILEDGKIAQFDRPEKVYQNPKNEYIAKCFGFMNIVKFNNLLYKKYCVKKCKGKIYKLFVRPESFDIIDNNAKDSFSGVIKLIYFHGQYSEFEVEIDLIDGKKIDNKFLITVYWDCRLSYSYSAGKRLYFRPHNYCLHFIDK